MNRTQQSTTIAICLLGLAVLAVGAVFLVREWREEVVERQRLQEENEQLRMEVEQLTVKRIISNRLNRYGVKEISIATQGEDAEPPVASRAEAETGAGVVAGPTGAGAGAAPTAARSEQ